ncbi:hypothetical protein [Nostoc sp. TCL26-01]|uniref:hypothetical protein n=1 Tax=Nostoc sp. TCL26-01 TaxID=2576904 RepID=UPI0015BBE7A3|nr:hypothetical protein [Nostoc sp. TCL26-01]QLE59907.1 hypothetical protein FD725_31275 [Nostoc sp. TCL26-01]
MTKLNESQQWIETEQKQATLRSQRSQQFRINLIHFARWIGSGWSGWLIYLGSFAIYLSLGFALGVNFPSAIACPNTKSYCYLLRLHKETVVIPSDYIKQTSPKKSNRQR